MARLSYTDIKQGVFLQYNDAVCECVESSFSKKSRQQGSNTVRLRNIATGAVVTKTLHSSDYFEEVVIEKHSLVYLYSHRYISWFHKKNASHKRIQFQTKLIAGISFIPEKTLVVGIFLSDTLLAIQVPIKVTVCVREAPPSIRGNTAQGGTKQVVLETGAVVSTPLFIGVGDCIQVNTETGRYVTRQTIKHN